MPPSHPLPRHPHGQRVSFVRELIQPIINLSLSSQFNSAMSPFFSSRPTDPRQAQGLVAEQEQAGGYLVKGGLCLWTVGLVCTT